MSFQWHMEERKADGYMLGKAPGKMEVKNCILELLEELRMNAGANTWKALNETGGSTNMSKWTSRGKNFRPMGAVWSSNPEKAERTIKGYSAAQKRAFARRAAQRYNGEY